MIINMVADIVSMMAIKRGTDMLLSGKKALVIGYGDVGKGSALKFSPRRNDRSSSRV